MGGPGADVLLRAPLADDEAAAFDAWWAEVFEPLKDLDGLWLLRAPAAIGAPPDAVASGSFSVEREPWDDEDDPCLPALIGYRPAEDIWIQAVANGRNDHVVLGHLCLTLARRFGGLVDFGGALSPVPCPSDMWSPETVRPWLASVSAALRALPGTVYEDHYETDGERPWVRHVGDADFLAAWLAHPLFRMIK
jgi:hypothetical protein